MEIAAVILLDASRTIKAARQRATNTMPGLTINQPVSEVRPMADANSNRPPVAGRSSNGTPLYECKCPSCGVVRIADSRRLGKRCLSCTLKERNTTHGLSNHPAYKLLKSMEVRCNYPSASNYEYYGGRGIKVCQEWSENPASFVAWAEANGFAPGLEIDRIDTDGPYAPWNCQFIRHAPNSQKRRNAKCNAEIARAIKGYLAQGIHYKEAALLAGVPPMVAWHIGKGRTWRDA
jgi:hypothetical protein